MQATLPGACQIYADLRPETSCEIVGIRRSSL